MGIRKFSILFSIIVLFFGIAAGVFIHYLLHRLILNMEPFIYVVF